MMILNDFSEKFTGSRSNQFPVLLDLRQALNDGIVTMCSRYTMNLMEKVVNHVQAHMEKDYPDFKKIYDEFNNNKINVSDVFKFIQKIIPDDYDKNLLKIFITYQDIKKNSTSIVKNISNDYVLFIPKSLYVENVDEKLGLSISKLKNYIFEAIPESSLTDYEQGKNSDLSTEAIKWGEAKYRYMASMNSLAFNHDVVNYTSTIGQRLIIALNEIKPKHADCLMNIYLIGHGSHDFTAEISTVKYQQAKDSDFVRFLKNLQNNFLMKSLSVTSCYSGGEKNRTAFQITNQFDNRDLEKISYPIIMGNSFFSPEFNFRIQDYPESFNLYFQALNQTPPDYSRAAKIFSGKDVDPLSKNINLMSIKMPHTSWFTPESFDQSFKKITQIQATAQKDFIFTYDIKGVFISANVINSITFKSLVYELPMMLPVNYMNQFYMINTINLPLETESQHSMKYLVRAFLPIRGIKESIHTVIKELIFSDGTKYRNICFFNYTPIEGADSYSSGYMYTNHAGKIVKNFWPYDEDVLNIDVRNEKEISVDEKMYYKELPLYVENMSKQSQKSIEELEKNLSQRSKPQFKIPKEVERSHKMIEEKSEHEWVKDPATKKWQIQEKQDKVIREPVKVPFEKENDSSAFLEEEVKKGEALNLEQEHQKEVTNSPKDLDFVPA